MTSVTTFFQTSRRVLSGSRVLKSRSSLQHCCARQCDKDSGDAGHNYCCYDLGFAEQLPSLFPARGKEMQGYFSDPLVAQITAFRNSSLQGAYLIIAARALGLDCGPILRPS